MEAPATQVKVSECRWLVWVDTREKKEGALRVAPLEPAGKQGAFEKSGRQDLNHFP